MSDFNPRATIGGNLPDYGKMVTDRLSVDYRHLAVTVDELIEAANELPEKTVDDDELGNKAKLIKRAQDMVKTINVYREKEKEQYLRGGQANDQFFFSLCDKLARRQKTNRPGIADVLQSSISEYQNLKLAEEQARRRREAEETERARREAQHKADREAQEAEQRRLAAERARKPETVADKRAQAGAAERLADAHAVEAALATERAEDARIATMVKPADIVRTRVAQGPLVTMRAVPVVEIEDAAKLDAIALWPYVKEEHKLAALKAWAKFTGHSRQMPGAVIDMRNDSVVR